MPKQRVLKNRNEEKEQPQQQEQHLEEEQPPRKMTRIFKGQRREYHYVTTVKLFEELDEFRFQVRKMSIYINLCIMQIFFRIIAAFMTDVIPLLLQNLLYHAQGKSLLHAILN
jgi:hypothetical protein